MKAKKSLGQNFLKSEPALRKIVEVGEIKDEDVILEIGPGRGALTERLLEKSKKVIAVEKDRELLELLQEKFKKEIETNTLILVCEDILEFDIDTIIGKAQNYKVTANIPYNITGSILKKFLTAEHQPECMVLMVQKEVAERILGRSKESILSISVKAYGEPKMIMKVPARYFSPSPKVDSAVIKISNISREIFSAKGGSASGGEKSGISEQKFWEIVKNGFAHKRKKLSGNLKNYISGEKLKNSPWNDKRAEDLRLEEWIALAKL